MKKLLSVFLMSASLLAGSHPLITKTSGGGLVQPEQASSVRCDVYQNKVVITNMFGYSGPSAFTVTEEREISLSKDLSAVIELAKSEKLTEKPGGPCDAPTTSITAGEKNLELFFSGACGTPRKERQGTASQKLINLVNLYCPHTIDFGAEK